MIPDPISNIENSYDNFCIDVKSVIEVDTQMVISSRGYCMCRIIAALSIPSIRGDRYIHSSI